MFGTKSFVAAMAIFAYTSASPIETIEGREPRSNLTSAAALHERDSFGAQGLGRIVAGVGKSPYTISVFVGNGQLGCSGTEEKIDPVQYQGCNDKGAFYVDKIGATVSITGVKLRSGAIGSPDGVDDVLIFRGGYGRQPQISKEEPWGGPDFCHIVDHDQKEVLLVHGGCGPVS